MVSRCDDFRTSHSHVPSTFEPLFVYIYQDFRCVVVFICFINPSTWDKRLGLKLATKLAICLISSWTFWQLLETSTHNSISDVLRLLLCPFSWPFGPQIFLTRLQNCIFLGLTSCRRHVICSKFLSTPILIYIIFGLNTQVINVNLYRSANLVLQHSADKSLDCRTCVFFVKGRAK